MDVDKIFLLEISYKKIPPIYISLIVFVNILQIYSVLSRMSCINTNQGRRKDR